MDTLKITSWNIRWLDKLVDPPKGKKDEKKRKKRIDAISDQITDLNPDILCVLEGVKGEARIDAFCDKVLKKKYKAVKASNKQYNQKGRQWIWFLVKPELFNDVSLLPVETWKSFAGGSWETHYWGDFKSQRHSHYRQPPVLVLNWKNTRIELIGMHAKSKFVSGGASAWKKGGKKQKDFIKKAIKARIKMTTEVANVRNYINKKFEQVPNPAIFVMGDLNDGPGKEHFEQKYIFFDLLSNLQGDVFSAKRFLNHALFDFDDDLRWSCYFKDFIDDTRDPHILLDHILFTQPLVDGSLPVIVKENSGYVEHEIHDLVNSSIPKYAATSDHRPVSIMLSENI